MNFLPDNPEKPAKDVIDWETSNERVIKHPRDPVAHSMTDAERESYQRGTYSPAGPEQTASPAAGSTFTPGHSHAGPAPAASPHPAGPTTGGAPVAVPTNGPPVQDGDSQRVQDRINRLYGRARSAEELNSQYESQISDLQSRLRSLETAVPYQSQDTQFSGYTPHLPAGHQPATADAPISRQELESLLTAQTQAFTAALNVQRAQDASRRELETRYPQLTDPAVRHTAEQIWASDPAIQRDPRGPEKAALMAIGIHGTEAGVSGPALGASAEARKQAISAMGPSIASGSPAAGNAEPSAADRYRAALEHATKTQRLEDFAVARQLHAAAVQAQGAASAQE